MIETKVIEIPVFPTLHGQDAIEALNETIKEFEEQKGKELTKKQANALIKIANELISSIEAEMESETLDKNKMGRFAFFKKLEDAVSFRFQFSK